MTPQSMIWIAMGLPLVAVAWVAAFGKLPNVREAGSIAVSVATFLVCCLLSCYVFAGQRPSVTVGDMMPGFSISFTVEPLGMLFALIASGLWILTTIYAIGYMRGHHEINQTRFFCCFALAIFAALAAAFAGNLFTLFVAYEIMTISTYPLVTHHGDEKARAGGRVYIGILLSTSVAFFMLAIVWTWHLAGTLDFTALMPFHRWLPAAMVAPTPVSALLHAVAVVKVGVFSVLKIVVYIFGYDLVRESGISVWICYVAGASILIGSLVAMTKDNLKARLAYSTISQLAYITLGAALATQGSVIGSGMHIAMHAVGKITLFFCAGAIYVGAHKANISDMRGLGRAMPFTFAAFLLACISIIGLPPGGGSWSKWLLAVGAADRGMLFLVATLMISSLLNIAYLVPIPIQAFLTPKGQEPQKYNEAPLMCVVPLCITAVGSVLLFFFAQSIYDVLLPITEAAAKIATEVAV